MTRKGLSHSCIGYCIIDSRGYCVGCGRDPILKPNAATSPGAANADRKADEPASTPPVAPAGGR